MNVNQQHFTACKATICSLTLTLMLSGCATQHRAQPPSCSHSGSAAKHIRITVNEAGKPEFDNFVCPNGPHNNRGDICNGLNELPDIRFILTGTGASTWEFVDFRLSEDGNNWPGKLPPGVKSDFEFGSDAAWQAGRPERTVNGNTMHIQNYNCHQFTVHYRVLLENPATGERRIVDPIIDNTGSQLQ